MSDQLVDCACGGKASWDYLVPDSDPVYVRCNGECGARIEGPDIGEAFRRWALCMAPSEPPRSESAQEWDEAIAKLEAATQSGADYDTLKARLIDLARAGGKMRLALRSAPASPEPHRIAEVVAAVARWQLGYTHPLTCGNNSSHTPLYPAIVGGAVVLRCFDCDYEQQHVPHVVIDAPPMINPLIRKAASPAVREGAHDAPMCAVCGVVPAEGPAAGRNPERCLSCNTRSERAEGGSTP